jgi:hypothetical protein
MSTVLVLLYEFSEETTYWASTMLSSFIKLSGITLIRINIKEKTRFQKTKKDLKCGSPIN